ncbi:hypothetical protein [Flavobacterium sp.]|uniref:hypothetical protein n=1 Tax=Flavobacterium sp. TaxID=239 RepID=UPI00374DBE64
MAIKLNYKNFEIELSDAPNYILNSADNLRQYKKVYYDLENQFRTTSKYAIIVKEFNIEVTSTIICESGGATGISKRSFILEDDKIWILICNKIYCLEVFSLELIWQKEFDAFTNFSIHKLENDFIIHGELEIFRITKEGEIVWCFGGRDIWLNTEGKTEFCIEKNGIRLFDFESNEYVLDFEGNQIEDNPRIIHKNIKKKWWNIFG